MGRIFRAIFGPKRASSKFSDFIRNASAADKKKVYTEVLKKATARQNEVTRKAQSRPGTESRPQTQSPIA
jgi:hypothetical protein